ncbi:PREDICTED: protein FAM114A2-like isoform X2 [Nicotiana attenuata]|uniref:protein FAM114A2-like isoform X2 n=1 Tax=Nicotiana attenuata TaxID=49451 RepID=UPI0009054605|nr:PREDICTED: protein FAM114A2-like isoform X2 [Nicotiana attenuata]
MGDKTTNHEIVETTEEEAPILAAESTPQRPPPPGDGGGGGGWGGGWGFSAFSYLTDLQKAATVAAEEISRNVALLVDTESSDKDGSEVSTGEVESGDESDKRRKAALEKLEKASEDSLLGQGLKVIDHSVENFASGAWQALGNAIKGGSDLVHKLENSAVNIGLPATPGSVAPSVLETGKTFTAKGMEALELLGRETMDLLISETGINIDKSSKEAEGKIDEDQFFEEVTFDRCFYIYGGPEQLEELAALSNHYAMLFNRKKAKLPSDQRSSYDGKLKEVQQIFDLSSEVDGSDIESEKGKKVETGTLENTDEVKNLHDSSLSKAAELAAGFANVLAGLAPNDMIRRTTGRLDTLHSEGVHRLSELCCFAVTQLLMLGESVISNANKVADQDVKEETGKIVWPEDSIERANVIRAKAQSMTRCVEAVSSSFITVV